MHLRNIGGLLVFAALVACTGASEQEPAAKKEATVARAASSPVMSSSTDQTPDFPAPASAYELPGDACTLDGYWSFFEAFARSPQVREKYTAPEASSAIAPFRIALVDDRWYYVEAGEEPGKEALELKDTREGNGFTVEYTRAELGPDGEVVRRHGAPGKYSFQFTNGCWQLTGVSRKP